MIGVCFGKTVSKQTYGFKLPPKSEFLHSKSSIPLRYQSPMLNPVWSNHGPFLQGVEHLGC
jgi:hypothetical protein